GCAPSPGQDPSEECFHDCHDSFGAQGAVLDDEGNAQEDGSSSRKQTELEEEYLLELEKDMPEEEKQKRRKESTGLKEKGNEHFKKGDFGEAEESYTKALQICPACFQKDRAVLFSNRAAAKMKQRLPQQIEERNEKLKKEMLGKLKDLGNLVLRPFGLSTENFQIKQDSSTGSYSINFVQNPNNNR
ncbi:hypothetical protein EK904_000929, partial [Melospiza melodia maxima]